MEKIKRKSYLRGMQEELKIAKDHKLHPAIIAELEERIEAHLQYKRDYHKTHYVSRKKLHGAEVHICMKAEVK